jgi:hypothetical protein
MMHTMTYSQPVGTMADMLRYGQSYIFSGCSGSYQVHVSECDYMVAENTNFKDSLCSTLSGFTAVGLSPMSASKPGFTKSSANTGFAVSTVSVHGLREFGGGVAGLCIWSGIFSSTVFVHLCADVLISSESNSLFFSLGSIDKAATASYHSPLLTSTVMYSCAAAGFCVTIISDFKECSHSVNPLSFRPCFSFGETLANKACLSEGTKHPVSNRFTGMILTSISTTTTCSSAFAGSVLNSICGLSQKMLPLRFYSAQLSVQNTIGIELHHEHAVFNTMVNYESIMYSGVASSSKFPTRSKLIHQQIAQVMTRTNTLSSLTFERSNVFFAGQFVAVLAIFVSTSTINKLNKTKQQNAVHKLSAKYLTINELFTQRP